MKKKNTKSPSLNVETGVVNITLSDKSYSQDLLLLKLTCEEVERDHPLRSDGEDVSPTPSFLRALSDAFVGLGVETSTPTAAWLIWQSVSDMVEQLKKTQAI